jgi:hypothetical protein
MADLELDLLDALQAAESTDSTKSGDCGCGGKSHAVEADLFGEEDTFGGADLGGQLDSALSEVELSASALTIEEELEFAALGDASGLTISDIAALAERYPGLKITFSN